MKYLDTLRALAAPRRAIPILVVCVPLCVAQWHFTGTVLATFIGVTMCVAFVAVGPAAWRILVEDAPTDGTTLPRLVAYGLLGAVPALVGIGIPAATRTPETFLTQGVDLWVCVALFWAGGWGLGRDVAMERRVQLERERAAEAARQAERAQLLAIRAHLDPHFLFNTLSAIAEWCRQDGEQAEAAILKLSAMLRQILAGVKSERWPLQAELDLVRQLLDLHLVRDPSWFRVEWSLPEPLPLVGVPPMLLLPLVENAVKHGPAKGHRGTIGVKVEHEVRLVVTVTSPGPWGGEREGGEGLATVRSRLELAYGRQARLDIGGVDGGTRAVVSLPT